MILIVAPFPSADNQKDGMVQRIAHVDELIEPTARIYLNLSFRRFLRKRVHVERGATIYRLNVFVHVLLIYRLFKRARVVYIHSAYNGLKALLFSTRAHIVFDAHGIVPEELEQEGHIWAARVLGAVERLVLSRCNTLVCVTHSMLAHFHAKYGRRPGRDELIIPILPRVDDRDTPAQALNATRNVDTVIYAGGMQVWQNVDKMLAVAEDVNRFHYTFLTGDLRRFQSRLKDSGIRAYDCRCIAPEEVKCFYLTHEYGFVLRDELLVNRVACPTKLMEYLYWGVLPIIISPRIGDFDAHSLRGVTLEQFKRGELPDAPTGAAMRRHNQRAVLNIFASAQEHQIQLQRRLIGAA